MNPKGSYAPSDLETELQMLCLGQVDHFNTFSVELMGLWVANIKRNLLLFYYYYVQLATIEYIMSF